MSNSNHSGVCVMVRCLSLQDSVPDMWCVSPQDSGRVRCLSPQDSIKKG